MKKCAEFPNKRRYNTEKDAQTMLIILGNKNLDIYHCETCSGWHLTKKKYYE